MRKWSSRSTADSSDNPSTLGGAAYVDWTAPVAGTVTISGDIWYADPQVQRSNNYILALGGTTLATGTVAYNGGSTSAAPITFNGGGTLPVTAGEVVSLEVPQSGGQAFGSFDGIDLSITETSSSTPEPGTSLLLGSALSLALLLRRFTAAR